MERPTWLFVAYGGGHIEMVVPVALRARELGLCEPLVLALTTAGPVAKAAGLRTVGVRNFVEPADAPWLAFGAELAARLPHSTVESAESAAYLGLSYADLVNEHGVVQAERLYQLQGRSAFQPTRLLQRVLRRVQPQLVCATNSPRAERAAIKAATSLDIASTCLVDLFAIDEKRWIGRTGFGDRVCVLNEAVRQSLLAMERSSHEVVVTGNPAFDRLLGPADCGQVAALRARLGYPGRRLLLWASHVEPASHPWRPGVVGDPLLPARCLQVLIEHVAATSDWLLAVRPHPSEPPPALPPASAVVLTGRDWPLAELLRASDAVCTLTSTVGLEAHLLGKPVIQVAGSIFEDAAPYARMGIARAATLASLRDVLAGLETDEACAVMQPTYATDKVVQVLSSLTQ